MSGGRKSPSHPAGPTLPYVGCPVCGDMPDHCRAFWKGGDKTYDDIPAAADRLVIVGAPFYNQDTSGSNWCLLQCPACGTYYDWDFEYEYLVNGSEDDINIRRLTPEEGARKAAQVAKHVAEAQARFASEAHSQVDVLLHSEDPKALRQAASWVFHAVNEGNDPATILAGLLAALARKGFDGETSSMLNLAFFTYGSRSREDLERLRAAVAAAGPAAAMLLGSTLRSCERSLRSL